MAANLIYKAICIVYIITLMRDHFTALALNISPRIIKPVFPWYNLSLSRSERLTALVKAMTIEEKITWINDGNAYLHMLFHIYI